MQCPRCRKQTAVYASHCLHCGAPWTPTRNPAFLKEVWVLQGIGLFLVVGGVVVAYAAPGQVLPVLGIVIGLLGGGFYLFARSMERWYR